VSPVVVRYACSVLHAWPCIFCTDAISAPALADGAPCFAPCAAEPVQAPSEVKGKPVDDIIAEWNSELEQRSKSFVKHAEALAQVLGRVAWRTPWLVVAAGSATPTTSLSCHAVTAVRGMYGSIQCQTSLLRSQLPAVRPVPVRAVGRVHPVQPPRAAGAGGGAEKGGAGPGEPGEEAAGGGRLARSGRCCLWCAEVYCSWVVFRLQWMIAQPFALSLISLPSAT
jgi:hypothetical protein